MNNMTAQLLTKLIELKAELDTADKKLTFKVTASNDLTVSVSAYLSGIICHVDLDQVTEETYNFVVNSIRAEFAC